MLSLLVGMLDCLDGRPVGACTSGALELRGGHDDGMYVLRSGCRVCWVGAALGSMDTTGSGM